MALELDPLTIATQGLLSNNTSQFAAQGLLAIEIDIVDPDDNVIVDSTGGIVDQRWPNYTTKEKEKLRARITVVATVDGIQYKEIKYTQNLDIKVRDISIDIDHKKRKPIIKINVTKKYNK